MKKQNQTASGGGQIFFFVLVPLLLAVCVMKYRDIVQFAQQNKDVSAVIKIVYPAWKTYDELYPPPPLEEETEAAEKTGKPDAGSKTGKGSSKTSIKHGGAHQTRPPSETQEHSTHFHKGSLLK